MIADKADALRALANTRDAKQTFLGYLIVQALILVLWWPKNSLFERIGATGEPTTFAAVAIFTGGALAYFTIQLGIVALPPCRSETNQILAWKTLGQYARDHVVQLGYLLALCTPVTLIAHSIASVPATNLPWIALITFVYASFYRLLASWLHLRWSESNPQLLANALRVVLVAITICTTFYLPSLSQVSVSRYLTQPTTATHPITFVLPFIVTYAALCVLLCIGLVRQWSRQQIETATSETSR